MADRANRAHAIHRSTGRSNKRSTKSGIGEGSRSPAGIRKPYTTSRTYTNKRNKPRQGVSQSPSAVFPGPSFSGFADVDHPIGQGVRLKDLETENTRLRRAIADLTLDKLILQEAARGNFFSIRGS